MEWPTAIVAASSGDVSYSIGYVVGRLLCCLIIIGGIAGLIVWAVRSSRRRSAPQNFAQPPYPPQGYYAPPPGYQPPPPGYQPPSPGYQPPPGQHPQQGGYPPPPGQYPQQGGYPPPNPPNAPPP
ncbi:MAG: hypothetical protein ABW022_18160 [Actinoplanes sp.]